MKIRSMKGVELDYAKFISQEARRPALGNANMNARGDIIASDGTVIKRAEQVVHEYYSKNPKAVKKVSTRAISPDVFQTPQEAVAAAKQVVQQDTQIEAQPPKRRTLADSEE